MTYDSPKQIALFLKERGLSLKKRFGQNFLISPGARRRIVSLLEPKTAETLWEIGPGIGSMTHMLLGSVARLVAFEIDHGLVKVLEESFGSDPRFLIVAGDYLKTWRTAVSGYGHPDAIVGNLPYSAAAPIIASLVDWEEPVGRAVLTVQREVGRRMAAEPGSKEYSGFSLICQSIFDVELHGDIAPASFHPAPEVTSTIVVLRAGKRSAIYDRRLFSEIVRGLFASRRKTVKNNLATMQLRARYSPERIEQSLKAARIEPDARGEELSVSQVVAFVRALDDPEPA